MSRHRSFVLLALIIALAAPAVSHASSSANTAVGHTDAVHQAYLDAEEYVEHAALELAMLTSEYLNASGEFNEANHNPETTAATIAAMEAAAAKLAAAEATLDAAVVAAEAAGVAWVAFEAGLGYYQLGAALWDLCWDPTCDVSYVTPGTAFTAVTDADLVPPLYALMNRLRGTAIADSDSTGIVGIARGYMIAGGRFFVNTARGAASGHAHDNPGLFAARDELQAEVAAIPQTVADMAGMLDTARVVPRYVRLADGSMGSALDVLHQVESAMDDVLVAASEPATADDPCQPSNGGPGCSNAAATTAAQDIRAVALAAEDTLVAQLLDTSGAPRTVLSLMLPITRIGLENFIQATRDSGESALPLWEVLAGDSLLSVAGVHSVSSSSIGPLIAAYDAASDTREANAVFADGDSTTLAHLLHVSATTLSNTGRWLNIDPSHAALLLGVPPSPRAAPLSVSPIPGKSVTIRFVVPTRTSVTLSIVDLTGRTIVNLDEGTRDAGSYTHVWTGVDGSGRRTPPGMYFARLTIGGSSWVHQVVLLR